MAFRAPRPAGALPPPQLSTNMMAFGASLPPTGRPRPPLPLNIMTFGAPQPAGAPPPPPLSNMMAFSAPPPRLGPPPSLQSGLLETDKPKILSTPPATSDISFGGSYSRSDHSRPSEGFGGLPEGNGFGFGSVAADTLLMTVDTTAAATTTTTATTTTPKPALKQRPSTSRERSPDASGNALIHQKPLIEKMSMCMMRTSPTEEFRPADDGDAFSLSESISQSLEMDKGIFVTLLDNTMSDKSDEFFRR